MKIVSNALSHLQQLYQSFPRRYCFVELCIVLLSYFLIAFVFRLWYHGIYFIVALGAVAVLVFVLSFFVHEDGLKDLGIRFDNILISLKEVLIVSGISLVIILILFAFYHEYYVQHTPKRLLEYFARYIAYGFLQQFIVINFLFARLKCVLKNQAIAIAVCAVIFSLMHAYNVPLMVLTFFLAAIACILFTRHRNLFTLGFFHAAMAMIVYITLAPGLINQSFHIGPAGTEKYSVSGDGAHIASGDVDGDGKDEIIVGRGPSRRNDTEVFIYDGDGRLLNRFHAYGEDVRYGVNLSAGDVDGDGVDEIIVSKGPAYKNDTVIKVFDADGEEKCRFTAFAKKRFGANIAAGDIDGDGKDEIIVSPGPGQGYKPIIGIFDETGESLYTIRAEDKIVNDNGYVMILRHGLQLGAGDVDGDGIDEILVGSAHVRDYKTYVAIMDAESESSIVQHEWFLPYIIGARFGVNIASGDVNGDGVDEILTGPGPYEYSGSHLKVFDNNWELLFGSFPFKCHYGLNVASGDIDGDGVYEIVVAFGPGEGNESTIKILNILEKNEREIEAF